MAETLTSKIKCPKCQGMKSTVVDTRGCKENTSIRRRRVCNCGNRYTTYEFCSESNTRSFNSVVPALKTIKAIIESLIKKIEGY